MSSLKLFILTGVLIAAGLSRSALPDFVGANRQRSGAGHALQSSGTSTAVTQSSQPLPTIDEVLDKYVQALGGRVALQAVTSRVTKGTITAPVYHVTGTVETYAKAPNRQLIEIKAPILGTSRTGFDGLVAWAEENGKVAAVPDFPKREADFYLPMKLREIYPRIELKGKEKIGSSDAYLLEAPRRGNPRRWWFDTETGLLLRTETRNAKGEMHSSEDYEDYRSVDGVKVAFTIREVEGGLETITRLAVVTQNVPIDDSKFEKPAANAPGARLSPAEQDAAAQVRAETVRAVTTALASRKMQGRGMGQPGGDRAAKYLAAEFARIGLKPGGDASTYFQQMSVKVQTPLRGTSFKIGKHVFKFKTDFAIAQPTSPSASKDARGPVVFVGYGVVADELKRDDLAGIDVKGKIVLVLRGKPQKVSTDVWDKVAADRAVFGRLIRKGAAGFVVVYQGEAAHFPAVAHFVSNRSVRFAEPLSPPVAPARWSIELLADEFDLPPSVLVSESAAEKIFRMRRLHFTRMKQRAEGGEFVSRDLNLLASISPRMKHEEGVSSNVIGVVEGGDPRLKNEAVVYTAHYDGFGIDSEGTIFPGATDNALGVGKLVATAEGFAHLQVKPRRTIIFIATTGEESGDLGAENWLQNPTWPLDKMAADLNYDGSILELWGKLGFLLDFGFEHSDLNETVREVAAASDLEIVPDPAPEEGYFTRGDHFAFVLKGVPSLFLQGGPATDPQRLFQRAERWLARDYHMPTDSLRPGWNWEGARMAARLGLITGLRVANREAMPAWKADSPYNRARGADLRPPPKP